MTKIIGPYEQFTSFMTLRFYRKNLNKSTSNYIYYNSFYNSYNIYHNDYLSVSSKSLQYAKDILDEILIKRGYEIVSEEKFQQLQLLI